MELHVERVELAQDPLVHRRELLGGHVVLRPPHRAGVGVAELLRAGVRDLDHVGIVLAHRPAGRLVPALPDFGELLRVAKLAHQRLGVVAGDGLAVVRRPPLAIERLQPRRDLVELGGRTGRRRRREHEAAAQQVQLARRVGIEARHLEPLRRLGRIFDPFLREDGAEISVQRVGIVVDVGRVDPRRVAADHGELGEVLLDVGDEPARAFRRAGRPRVDRRRRRQRLGDCDGWRRGGARGAGGERKGEKRNAGGEFHDSSLSQGIECLAE